MSVLIRLSGQLEGRRHLSERSPGCCSPPPFGGGGLVPQRLLINWQVGRPTHQNGSPFQEPHRLLASNLPPFARCFVFVSRHPWLRASRSVSIKHTCLAVDGSSFPAPRTLDPQIGFPASISLPEPPLISAPDFLVSSPPQHLILPDFLLYSLLLTVGLERISAVCFN